MRLCDCAPHRPSTGTIGFWGSGPPSCLGRSRHSTLYVCVRVCVWVLVCMYCTLYGSNSYHDPNPEPTVTIACRELPSHHLRRELGRLLCVSVGVGVCAGARACVPMPVHACAKPSHVFPLAHARTQIDPHSLPPLIGRHMDKCIQRLPTLSLSHYP